MNYLRVNFNQGDTMTTATSMSIKQAEQAHNISIIDRDHLSLDDIRYWENQNCIVFNIDNHITVEDIRDETVLYKN